MYRRPGIALRDAPPVMPTRRVWPIYLLILSLPILVPVGFVLLIMLHYDAMHYVPKFSAQTTIAEPAATVTATAYYDGTRYLNIRVNGRRYVRQLPRPRYIFDLGSTPWFETCLYRTARNEIAFNMWRYIEIIADEAYRPDDGIKALEGATYLGVFQPGARVDELIFKPADPPRPAAVSESNRTAC